MALTTRQAARKSYLEGAIPKLEAAIEGSFGAAKLTIAGRSLERYTLEELESLRAKYDAELTRLERRDLGVSNVNTIRVTL